MKTIWNVLGIEETSDVKTIKRAYAQKLKKSRPDESPDAFQLLHRSYKIALSYAQSSGKYREQEIHTSDVQEYHRDEPESAEVVAYNATVEPGFSVAQEDPPESAQMQSARQLYQAELDRMMEIVNGLLADPRQCELKQWEFITQSEYILDPHFTWELGEALLQRLIHYFNNEEYKQYGDYRLTLDILFYLDSIFRWRESGMDVEGRLTKEYGEMVFKKFLNSDRAVQFHNIDQRTQSAAGLRGAKSLRLVEKFHLTSLGTYYYGSGLKRLMAMGVDLMIVSIPLTILNSVFVVTGGGAHRLYQSISFHVLVVSFGLLCWLSECSKWQSTPGKFLLGLRVADKNQEKLSLVHGLLRTMLFLISCIGVYITILINAWSGGKFIHDRLTRSYVIDVRRSRKEQQKRKNA